MVKLPIVVPSTVITPMLTNLIRLGLVALGVALQGRGILPAELNVEDGAAQLAGQIMILIGLVWSQYRAAKNAKEKKEMAERLPDAVAVVKDPPVLLGGGGGAKLRSPTLVSLLAVALLLLSGCATMGGVGNVVSLQAVSVTSPAVCAAQAALAAGTATPEQLGVLTAFDAASALLGSRITRLTGQPARVILDCE